MNKLLPIIAVVALLGQGCPTPVPMAPSAPPRVEPRMGFGKLPSLTPLGESAGLEAPALGMAGTQSAVPKPAMPAPAADAAVTGGGVVGMPSPIRIDPGFPEWQPVDVEYHLLTELPLWNGEGDVQRVIRPQPGAGVIGALSNISPLPSQIVSRVHSVQSVNASWRDADGYVWNFDPIHGGLGWWRQYDERLVMPPRPQNGAPDIDEARALAAADRFLDAQGLSAVRALGGQVEEPYWTKGVPCILEDVQAREPAGDADLLIYPSPCDWYPQEITVFYGTSREGLPVTDAGGWPRRMSSVSVSLVDYTVSGGNVEFEGALQRSAYPLIDRETARTRLEAGGRNPVWSWGPEGGSISVIIDRIDLAWMRYDVWREGGMETYYLPALAASGLVDRRIEGQEPEAYHTVIPLVSDDAFDFGEFDGPFPMPRPLPAQVSPSAPAPDAPVIMDLSAPAPEPQR